MAIRPVRVQSKKAFSVESAALRYGDIVSTALAERLPQPLPPPPVEPSPDGTDPEVAREEIAAADATPAPDWAALQAYIAVQLRIARQRLLAASHERELEVHDDPEARTRRDEAASEAYEQLVRTRQALRAAIGDDAALKILGVEGATPQQPDALLERLQEAVFHLRKAETQNVEVLLSWMQPPDWDGLIADLDGAATRLEDAITDVKLGERDSSGALVERDRIRLEIRDIVNGLTLMLEGIYHVAGRTDLGDRIRPTVATPAPAEPETPEDDGSSDGGGTPGGPQGPNGPNGSDVALTLAGAGERKEVVPVVTVLPDDG
jgi:hypothetical protein